MNKTPNRTARRALPWAALLRGTALCAAFAGSVLPVQSATPLADQPLFSAVDVPGNLLLALSVEFPTAISVANLGDYSATQEYLGYFDPNKCYVYESNTLTPAASYFRPAGAATSHVCSGKWSGNFMNWATMQTIDPYRWALTGGYRSVDTAANTILEKAWGSAQGGNNNFPNRGTDQAAGHKIPAATIPGATPLSWSKFNLRIWSRGNRMVFTGTGGNVNAEPGINWTSSGTVEATAYQVYVRVQVCSTATGAGGVESNCQPYGSNYKPEGLLQKYASKIRYSAFGYLNDSNINRDGGVMRARMKFIGPTKPVPGAPPTGNALAEWSASTGVFTSNPDPTDATSSGVSNSGVMNYLNKFGQSSGVYKTYDNIGEMYYAALRYYKKQGNVPEWTNSLTTAMIDGFPVITNWEDPLLYRCQKNFILGIGDTNTHADGNLPGSSLTGSNPAMPSAVKNDTTVDVTKAANKIGELEGLGTLGTKYAPGGTNNTYYMAGLAYDAHTVDMRPDLADDVRTQTVATYWLDVLEYQNYVSRNFYWLTAKYGGFTVPDNYEPYKNTTPLASALWNPEGETVSGSSDKRPENYFTANRADKMVAALKMTFDKIANSLKANTTSFSSALPQIASSGSASYAGKFDATSWTGELEASTLTYTDDVPSLKSEWTHSAKLGVQLAGTGWDIGRRVVTWNGSQGVPFRAGSLDSTRTTALATPYAASKTAADYVNYLRGDRSNERTSTDATKAYRMRSNLLGDIVGSKVRPVGPPSESLSDASNPGYAAFKKKWAARPTAVYFGANDGMLHAVMGDLKDAGTGKELFAYVPGALYSGPNATPAVDGLAALGNPTFAHHYYVNASPTAYDIDLGGAEGWRTVLIGGLGKGGRGYYAVDVTDPVGMSKLDEAALAKNVMWETSGDSDFADMGFSYGDPVVVKTRQHGWVVVLTSGYNNSNGQGYFYIVNPRTGKLIQKIGTGEGSSSTPAGLTHAVGFINDRSVGLADAIYAGDLLGNVWRLDLTAKTGAYPKPTLLATLKDASDKVQPVTSKPTVAAAGGSLRRFVMLGTGKLLADSDVASGQAQTFYAILDGKEAAFGGTLPSGITLPVGRGNLVENKDPVKGVTVNTDTHMGWFLELGGGWRVVSDPTSGAGLVSFSSTLPSVADTCKPSGSSRVYSINFGTGASNLADGAYVEMSGTSTDVRLILVDGELHGIAGQDNSNTLTDLKLENKPITRQLRRVNWRELPLAD